MAQQATDQPTLQIESTKRGKQPVVTALTSKKSVADKPSEFTCKVKDVKSDETDTMRVRLIKLYAYLPIIQQQFQYRFVE